MMWNKSLVWPGLRPDDGAKWWAALRGKDDLDSVCDQIRCHVVYGGLPETVSKMRAELSFEGDGAAEAAMFDMEVGFLLGEFPSSAPRREVLDAVADLQHQDDQVDELAYLRLLVAAARGATLPSLDVRAELFERLLLVNTSAYMERVEGYFQQVEARQTGWQPSPSLARRTALARYVADGVLRVVLLDLAQVYGVSRSSFTGAAARFYAFRQQWRLRTGTSSP